MYNTVLEHAPTAVRHPAPSEPHRAEGCARTFAPRQVLAIRARTRARPTSHHWPTQGTTDADPAPCLYLALSPAPNRI